MISANGGLPAHRYTPQVTQRWPRGSEPASNQKIKTQHDSMYMRAHVPLCKAGGSIKEMEMHIANQSKSQPLSLSHPPPDSGPCVAKYMGRSSYPHLRKLP